MSKKVKRLYAQFKPSHYDIALALSQDKKSFKGSVTITGTKVGRPSERLTLHQKALKITNPKIVFTDKKKQVSEIPVTRVNLQKSYDEVRLHSDQTLYPGEYTISMDFEGPITKNMDGVYPAFFEDDGVKKELVATQFESHHAREAFPCVDEPEAKATFQLTLSHPKDEIALSNTLPENETASGNVATTKFGATPIMSTYLLAFVVGELESREAKSKSGVTVRTFATKNQIEHTAFALEEAVAYMDFYEEYYDIPFPLEKCDFVALPDFASGAMENWGLITFREQGLLLDDKLTSLSTKQYVSLVVAHELTHQWFGNLVTMRWWTDLWLNEGFASWMEYLAVDKRHPDWHFWTQFSVDEQQLALKMDALEHTHPIEVEVNHPDEIRSIFDAISYQKGASMIHMLHDHLGAETFRDGLRHYLKTYAYKNTDTVDLWQALEDVAKRPVKDFMHAWTSQGGFPLLSVSMQGDHLKISQSKFVTNPLSTSRNDEALWPIPLLADNLEKPIVSKQNNNVVLTDNKTAPIKLNSGKTGFYRVDYSPEMQKAQLAALKNGGLSDVDRMGLLSDGLEVTRAGYQSVSEFLDLLENYRAEDTLPVWEIIASGVDAIRHTLSIDDQDDTLRDAMKPFVQKLVSPQLAKLGLSQKPSEPHLDTLLRPIIVGLAAGAEDEKVEKALLAMYQAKIDSDTAVDPDLRGTIYSVAAKKGGQKQYDELLKLYKDTDSSDEKLSITAAMTSFEQPELHQKVLDLLKGEEIKLQDVPYWIVYSLMNRHSRALAWAWMKDNWPWMKKTMGTDLSFARYPVYAARNFADEKFLSDYQEFFSANMEPIIKRTYDQGVEIIQTNSEWRKRDAQSALKWFSDKH